MPLPVAAAVIAGVAYVGIHGASALQSWYNGEPISCADDPTTLQYWEGLLGTMALAALLAGIGPSLLAAGAPAAAVSAANGLLGVGAGLYSGYHGYSEFQQGNYITAAVDLALGGLSFGAGAHLLGASNVAAASGRVAPSSSLPRNPYDVSTQGMTAAERQAAIEYAQRTNAWLEQNGPVSVQSTKGVLRSQASAAARTERLNAARAGQPYQGQAGHVPDTALTGQPQPPGGWLDMPGKSNNIVGGGLGPRVGTTVDRVTVDGRVP